jgi:hypothetical protein
MGEIKKCIFSKYFRENVNYNFCFRKHFNVHKHCRAVLSLLSYPGRTVLPVLSRVTCEADLSRPTCLPVSCSVPVVLFFPLRSELSNTSCPFLDVLAPAFLSLALLSALRLPWLSFSDRPVFLFCSVCPALATLSRLDRLSCLLSCPVSPGLSLHG